MRWTGLGEVSGLNSGETTAFPEYQLPGSRLLRQELPLTARQRVEELLTAESRFTMV